VADSFHFCVFHGAPVLPKQAMTAIERRHGRNRHRPKTCPILTYQASAKE
jgi:hypothetical protein